MADMKDIDKSLKGADQTHTICHSCGGYAKFRREFQINRTHCIRLIRVFQCETCGKSTAREMKPIHEPPKEE